MIITLLSKHQNADLNERRLLWTQQQQLAAMEKMQGQQSLNAGKKSISEELESLQRMREAGHLTEEEYQQAKNKVIAAN